MRIVGGSLRGRRLATPAGCEIRPTTDRVRESVFNILANRLDDGFAGLRVLDVFAGTGALGIEAVSRGAAYAVFFETGTQGTKVLRQNIETLQLDETTRVFRRDAIRPGPLFDFEPFDLMFADPPYAKGLGEQALSAFAENGWLRPGAICVLEERQDVLPERIDGFTRLDVRSFGNTAMGLFCRAS